MILEIITWGFFSAVGWWGANYYLIDPYFPKHETKVELKQESKQDIKSN
jgi:hypothetical protein